MADRQRPEQHPFADFFSDDSAAPRDTDARDDDAATFASAAPQTRRQARPLQERERSARRRDPRKRRRGLIALVVVVVLLGGLIAVGSSIYSSYAPQISALFAGTESDDYTGTGTGEKVDFVINAGDVGDVIGDNLEKAGVVKSSATFYSLLLSRPAVVFQPGTYSLSKEMSSQAALTALEDPASAVTETVVVPEGTAAADVLSSAADASGVALADLQAEAANFTQFGIDASAPNIEGYLFPATYTFQPGTSAHDIVKTMVDRTFQALDQAGVAPADREKTLVLASVIQKEAALKDDFYKVSRVFQNRIADDMPLQSDATVAYGTGAKRVDTTDAERNDESNKYNTYVYKGLPVGPISNPGDLAIDAALRPADGTWIYFVTVNLDSGETVFSTTLEEHEQAVAQYQAWSAANPGAGG